MLNACLRFLFQVTLTAIQAPNKKPAAASHGLTAALLLFTHAELPDATGIHETHQLKNLICMAFKLIKIMFTVKKYSICSDEQFLKRFKLVI